MNKDYICLHCAKREAGTCRFLPDSNTVSCGLFYPRNVADPVKAAKIKNTVNKMYEHGGKIQ